MSTLRPLPGNGGRFFEAPTELRRRAPASLSADAQKT